MVTRFGRRDRCFAFAAQTSSLPYRRLPVCWPRIGDRADYKPALRFCAAGLWLLLGVAGCGNPAAGPVAEPADGRPNILFCLADDWSWPHAGIYGDSVVITPN